MKVDEHIFIENTNEYKEIIEDKNKITSKENNFSGMCLYQNLHRPTYKCTSISQKNYSSYNHEQILLFGKEILNSIYNTSNNIVYSKGIIMTINRDIKILKEKNEYINKRQDGLFICEIEYIYKGQYYQKLFSKGVSYLGEEIQENWLKNLNIDQILRSIGNEMDFNNSMELISGIYDLYLSPNATGILIHEVFGHVFEKDNKHINKELINELASIKMPDNLNIEDNPFINNYGRYISNDDSGRNVVKLNIIKNGRLSEEILNGERIANRKRAHYYSSLQYRVSNTILENGNKKPEDILDSINSGIYIKKIDQCFCDPINGKIILPVIEAYCIKNGNIENYIKPFTIMSNVVTLAKSISAICNNYMQDIIICGKMGDKIPVGIGAPSILLSNIEL